MRPHLLVGLALLFPGVISAEPLITFEEQSVVASGMSPGGQVVWFSVAKQIEGRMADFVRRDDLLIDEDGDGSVRFELGRDVPRQSIWVAVDLATGEAAVATPEGYPLRDASLAPGRGRGEAGRPDWSEEGRQLLELLVVRPGEGAWGLAFGDGGARDEDGRADGRITAALARLQAVGRSPAPPERFHPRDLVFAVDLNRMEILTERVPAPVQ
jgi:hypothetical protein